MNNLKTRRVAVFLIPGAVIVGMILFFLTKDWFLPLIPPCMTYQLYHIQCPGCGGTRSVLALLRGDIITSIRFNPAPVMLSFLLICLYIELVFKAFFKEVKLLPRKLAFWIVIICIFLGYYVFRNYPLWL